MSRLLALMTVGLLTALPLAAQSAPITVFVVRHAEKGPENPDPPLTEAGQQRAATLARIVGDAGVTALFTSEFKRTRETLAPLAARTGLTPVVIPAGKLDSLITAIRALPPGSRAVVASHSNLVHLIVQRLSGVQIPELTDQQYDQLAIVEVHGEGKGEAVVIRY